jgi:hypothetical protein
MTVAEATQALIATVDAELAAKQAQVDALNMTVAADRLQIADLESDKDELTNQLGTLQLKVIDLEAEIDRLQGGTNPPPPEPPPEPDIQVVAGPQKLIKVNGPKYLRINGAIGLDTYNLWMEDCRQLVFDGSNLPGNSREATVRISTMSNSFSEWIEFAGGTIWGMAAPKDYTDAGKMPKPCMVIQAAHNIGVRRVAFYGVGPGVGVLTGAEHPYMKGVWNENVMVTACTMRPNDAVPMSGARIEVAIGSRNVTYEDNLFEDAGELTNGKALFDIGGQMDAHGTRTVESLTISNNTGTIRYKGVPIVRDNAEPARAKYGMGNALILEGNSFKLVPNATPIRWPLQTLVFPNGWHPERGWRSSGNVWPSYGNARPVRVGDKYLTAAEWNALEGVDDDRFE